MKILNYLDAQLKFTLFNLNKSKLIKSKTDIEILLEEVDNFKLQSSEERKVNNKLVEIQLNLFENSTNILKNVINNFEKLSNYEEKGNFNMAIGFNEENTWKINSIFNFNDYTIKSSNFDTQVKWHIKALINATPKWEEAIKMEFESFLDFISKDWNIYVLLNKLNITSKENIEKFEKNFDEILSKLENLAKKNKYIKFEDKDSEKALNILKSLTPNKIISDWKKLLSKPLFKPYKKEWKNKYYLIPTKYACDEIKKLANRFDPFNWKKCSESQYNDLLEEIKDIGSLYIEIKWNNTILGFEWIKTNNMDYFNWYVNFTNKYIKEIFLNVIPNQNEYPNEWLTFDYKKSDKLNFNMYASEWEININLISNLNKNNKFTHIDYTGNIKWYNSNFTSRLNLKNKKISGEFNYESNNYKYDYDTWEWKYVLWYKLSWNINWNTKSDNSISNLKIDYSWDDLETNTNTLNGNIDYNFPKFSFINNFNLENIVSELNLTWEIDNINKNLKTFDFDISIKEKTENNSNEILNLNISLINKIISWELIIKENWENLLIIETNWEYEKKFLELNNSFKTAWNLKKTIENISWNNWIENIFWNFNIKTDLRNNKDNYNIYFDLNFDKNKIIELNIDNKSTIEYKKVDIKKPTNIINFEEIEY